MLGIGREILGAILGYLITELFKWLATLPLDVWWQYIPSPPLLGM
jgi:hypothetical protein